MDRGERDVGFWGVQAKRRFLSLTSASTLHDLGQETLVIDTPGVRQFGLWDLTAEELRQSFLEFQEAAEACRFNDCTHLHEPDCEVKRRVENGAIDRARYDAYVRLAKDLAEQPCR